MLAVRFAKERAKRVRIVAVTLPNRPQTFQTFPILFQIFPIRFESVLKELPRKFRRNTIKEPKICFVSLFRGNFPKMP